MAQNAFGGMAARVEPVVRAALMELRRLLALVEGRATALEAGKSAASTGAYTPTLVGMSVGSGGGALNTADWTFVGGPAVGSHGDLTVFGRFLFGTTAPTYPASATLALPSGFNMVNASGWPLELGQAGINDAGVEYYPGIVKWATASAVAFTVHNTAAAFSRQQAISTTVPHTFGPGDFVDYAFACRAVRV